MTEENKISEKILEIVLRSNPETVEGLVNRVEEELDVPKEELLKYVEELEKEGRLKLSAPPDIFTGTLYEYITSTQSLWFWIVVALSVSTTISVYTIPETVFPLVYIRYILGTIFVVFLPGFSLVKALFPTREIDNIERFALNIGMSLALVPLVGLLLNYTPWGIRLTPITMSLLVMTLILSSIGFIREFHVKSTKNGDNNS